VTTNGLLTSLVSFNGTNGAEPCAGLAIGNNGVFYGTTAHGGPNGEGTVFRMTTGGELVTVASFSGPDGANPESGLIQDRAGELYGTTVKGGDGYGTVFKVATNGPLSTLVSFNGTNGSLPFASLAFGKDGHLYGTTAYGGNGFNGNAYSGNGVVFRLSLVPQITLESQFDRTKGLILLASGLTGHGQVILQVSSNLVDWAPTQTNPPVVGCLMFQDASFTNRPVQFYRVLLQ
jgi:uncharacterized repeat protein (TIGR03803 family)